MLRKKNESRRFGIIENEEDAASAGAAARCYREDVEKPLPPTGANRNTVGRGQHRPDSPRSF